MADHPLATELAFYDASRAQLLSAHRGKYALIKGKELIGVFDSSEAAVNEGTAKFGLEPFLVKLIIDVEPEAQYPALVVGLISARP